MKAYNCTTCKDGILKPVKGIGISDVTSSMIKEFVTMKCDKCGKVCVITEQSHYTTSSTL